MAKYEYQHVPTEMYNRYAEKANLLLQDIAYSRNIEIKDIRYKDIISFFQTKFNLHFAFFEADPAEIFKLDDEWPPTPVNLSWIKYKDLVYKPDFQFLPAEIVERISGVTIPSGKRTLIMVNQDRVIQRVIFTILHELCHFYFHILDKQKSQVFVSLSTNQIEGHYSPELIPFENEANNIASILFCPAERLEYMLIKKYTFKDMCRSTGMSEPAMHNRLLNYFEHILHLTHRLALSYVFKIRNQNINIYPSIIYKINAKINEQSRRENEAASAILKNAYVDKYGDSPFWHDIFTEMNMVSEDELNGYH
jgi:Zn-dependent peptidase ImmA (M78 family)